MALSISSQQSSRKPGRRRFIDKILRKRLSLDASSLSPPSLGMTRINDSELDTRRPSRSRGWLHSLGRSLETHSFLDNDANSIYNHDSGIETDFQYDTHDDSHDESHDESHDGMLDLHADVFSNDSVDSYARKNEKVDFQGLGPAVLGQDEEKLPWAGVTYEALVFPKLARVTRKSNKSPKLLNNLFLAQELGGNASESEEKDDSSDDEDIGDEKARLQEDTALAMNPNETLVMEFSKDGKYLAVAGRDCRITVWQVISSPLSRLQYNNKESLKQKEEPSRSRKGKSRPYRSAPVFHLEPVVVFEGHTSTILSLNWSKNNFLISGSMDWTVKLWNVEREECLETFQHDDFVTAVAFHPTDDRFFVSGSLDNCVRLWSILESSVSYIKNLGDDVMVTALALTPTGNYVIVGGFNGSLFALETNGLHFVHRIELKENSMTFHHRRNNKITGIRVFENPSAATVPKMQLLKWNILVTTNDSKVRLIDLGLRKLVTRFKGSSNSSSSIVASLSEDDKYIISGSEDHWCYVWENNNSIINNKLRSAVKDIYIEGKILVTEKHKKVTKALQDSKIWKKLNMQHFLDDANSHAFVANENSSYTAFHAHHNSVNAAIFAPDTSKKLLEFSDDIIYDLVKRGPSLVRAGVVKRKDSDPDELNYGHIIVTSDTTGLIRVFRQDSAYFIRKGLVEFRKTCKSSNHAELCPLVSNGRKLDLGGLNKKLIKTRSTSPSIDRSLTFKTLQNKLKPNPRNGTFTPSSNHLSRPQSSRSTVVLDSPSKSYNVVSSSSQVNLQELNKSIPRTKDDRLNVTLAFRDDDARSISDESTAFKYSGLTPTIGVSPNTPPRAVSPFSAKSPSAFEKVSIGDQPAATS